MQKVKLTLLVAIVFIVASCKKNLSEPQLQQKKTVDPAKVFKTPSTPEEKLLVENLGKVSGIFQELYKNKANLLIVNAAIAAKAYSDESVLLKDLIYPSASRLNKFPKFATLTQKWNVSLNKFSENFWIEVAKKKDAGFSQFLKKLDPNSSTQFGATTTDGEPVTVYYPYYEEFLTPDGDVASYAPITTVATATADADEGFGDLPYYLNGIFQYNVQVLINDDYCFVNPTHIIGVNGIEPEPEPIPNEPPPPPPPPPGISRVYIGEGICKNQYDRLISFTGNGGGSEIKYCHMTGYLQPVNGQVTTFQDIVSVNFTRRDINRKRWLRTFIIWDDDWVPGDLEQFLGIYEEDNTNSRTFSGSVGTTLTLDTGNTVTGTIGFSITVQSQDDIIRQLKISRNSYFTGAFQDNGQGFSNDATFLPLPFTHRWPAYDVHYQNKTGADVGWTWPYNTF